MSTNIYFSLNFIWFLWSILEWNWSSSWVNEGQSPVLSLGLVRVTETCAEWREEGNISLESAKLSVFWHPAIVQLLLPPSCLSNGNYSKKCRDCYPLYQGVFLILFSPLFWPHRVLLTLLQEAIPDLFPQSLNCPSPKSEFVLVSAPWCLHLKWMSCLTVRVSGSLHGFEPSLTSKTWYQ